jgi:hypothetical protein
VSLQIKSLSRAPNLSPSSSRTLDVREFQDQIQAVLDRQGLSRKDLADRVLELDVTVTVNEFGATTKMSIDGRHGGSVDDALDNLATYLERSAMAIRQRGAAAVKLPLYGVRVAKKTETER